MQTILGSTGAIGTELAKELTEYTSKIRLVSRNPKKINENDELVSADLLNPQQTNNAVKGSEVVYLIVGLKYDHKVWRKSWPVIMRNVIDACKKHNAKLVFFDNVYMYDPNYLYRMNEDTPVKPVSKKGNVRAEIAETLMKETKQGELTSLIARAADFMGPKNSIPAELIYKNLSKGKKAMWMVDVNKLHNFTNVRDAAKGTAMLGNNNEAYSQVWHLPTDSTELTMKQWIELIAKELNKKPSYSILSKSMMGMVGLFNTIVREMKEMSYQYDHDYLFDSSKFNKKFDYTPMTPKESIRYVKKELGIQ
jgi:nucleoside-diphosphate-sugar epimerase